MDSFLQMRFFTSLGLAAGVAAAVAVSAPVSAQVVVEDVIVIPVDSRFGAPPGSVTQVASVAVPEDFQGVECIFDVQDVNNESVHPNNDLILSSGSTSGEVQNFETEAFGTVGASLMLTLGPTVDVSIRMGPDGRSSGGVNISVDCPLPAAPTTTAPTPSTSEPTPEVPESTPSVPATTPTTPVGVGGETASNAPGGAATLPATGPSGTFWAGLIAAIMLVTGGGLVYAVRRPH